jgi:AcrR family transcriptional regulator
MVNPAKRVKAAEPGAPAENPAAQRMITAARRHFLAHGFRSVTMDDLAEELGMSKKTLYASFPSKDALLRAVLLDKFRSVELDLDRIMAECSTDVLEALHRLLACMQRHTEEIQPPFVRDIRREAPDMFTLVEERRRGVIQRYFGKLFEEGRRAGIIRKDIPARLMIETLLGAVQAIMNPPKMADLGLTPKLGYSAITTIVLEGVLTEKGRSKERPGEREIGRQGTDKETGRRGDTEKKKETRRQGDRETGRQEDPARGDV